MGKEKWRAGGAWDLAPRQTFFAVFTGSEHSQTPDTQASAQIFARYKYDTRNVSVLPGRAWREPQIEAPTSASIWSHVPCACLAVTCHVRFPAVVYPSSVAIP